MKFQIKNIVAALLVVPAMVFAFGAFTQTALAAEDLSITGGAKSAQGTDQSGSAACLFGTEAENCDGESNLFKTITNVLLFLIGAVSVIMLVIGGIRYTVSGGDQGQVTSAKNTILYAIVGIVVALLAYAVVNFVIGSFVGGQ